MWRRKWLIEIVNLRDHPASQVYVTGTFDDWARSVKLEKKADRFEKIVELPLANEKIYYKVRSKGSQVQAAIHAHIHRGRTTLL